MPRYCCPSEVSRFRNVSRSFIFGSMILSMMLESELSQFFTVLIAMDLMPYSSWNERARLYVVISSSQDHRDKFQFFCFHI